MHGASIGEIANLCALQALRELVEFGITARAHHETLNVCTKRSKPLSDFQDCAFRLHEGAGRRKDGKVYPGSPPQEFLAYFKVPCLFSA
jgi:hypothetical protein